MSEILPHISFSLTTEIFVRRPKHLTHFCFGQNGKHFQIYHRNNTFPHLIHISHGSSAVGPLTEYSRSFCFHGDTFAAGATSRKTAGTAAQPPSVIPRLCSRCLSVRKNEEMQHLQFTNEEKSSVYHRKSTKRSESDENNAVLYLNPA